jgi:hypothetical protein
MMKRDLRYSRRNLLKTIGAGAALLPLLEADPADAQCIAGGIKRMYILCWPDGMLSSMNSWSPAGNDPASWQLAPFQAALKPYQSDLLLLNGVDYKFLKDGPHSESTGHACYPGMLTGALYMKAGSGTGTDVGGGISIDQYVGNQLKQKSGYTGLVSLNQGAFVDSTARLSWSGAGQAIVPDFDPYHVFTTYVKGKITAPTPTTMPTPAPTTTPAPAPTVDYVKATQKSILDSVMGDLTRFGKIVGTADKAAIDRHLGYIRDIETGLGTVGGGQAAMDMNVTMGSGAACGIPAGATATPQIAFHDTASADKIAKLHMDLAIAAFAADLTRCCVMQIGDQGAAHLILTWLNFKSGGANPGDANTGDVNGFHAIAHRNVAEKVTCDTWFQGQIAYLIGQMKSVADPMTQKSMLDSSVIVGMNNMRTGIHETTGVPVVMAGSCGGYFKTGRSLALPAGTPNNALLVSLANAMLPTQAPLTSFGAAMYGGELAVIKGT